MQINLNSHTNNDTPATRRLINKIKQRSQCYLCYKYNYTPKDNNTYQLFSEGDQFYPAMLDAIDKAQSYIYIIQYIFETGLISEKFIDSLVQARQRGIEVRMILDAYGSSRLSVQERQRLYNAGIQVYFFNPLRNHNLIKFLYRDHRKLLVVDGEHAFIGGAGICDDYNFPLEHPKSWQDIVVKITGTLALDSAYLFQQQRKINQKEITDCKEKISASSLALNTQQGRLLTSKTWHHNEIQRAILHAIRKAKHRVWITTPYFVPTRKLRSQLKAAAHRGCDVRLLLPGASSDHPWVSHIARQRYSRLLKNQVSIFEYQNRFTHAKAILCDDWVCIGSSNLDRWNQKFNLELNVEIQSTQLTEQLCDFFRKSFDNSKQIDRESWKARPRTQKIKEWFWSKIATWIERFVHNTR